jgi:hypothetical protein
MNNDKTVMKRFYSILKEMYFNREKRDDKKLHFVVEK